MLNWKLAVVAILLPSGVSGEKIDELMPQAEDQSSMWWAEGFPGVVEGAPWHRVIETDQYAMVLDTEKMMLPHFGERKGKGWNVLPAAKLALEISVDGKAYECLGAEGASRHGGPRLVEAGRFFQRADVTDLIFKTKEGEKLNVEARFETAAWSDRLGFVFEAKPGLAPIVKGEDSFGKAGGGFGLDGTNELTIPVVDKMDSNLFTWSFWAFLPEDYASATKAIPWLMTHGRNEAVDGNIGIILVGGKATATINTGGGSENQVRVTSEKLRVSQWNHFLLSYDGSEMRFHVNGKKVPGGKVGKPRKALQDEVIFGRRGDAFGDGFHFVGVLDEVRVFGEVVDPKGLRKAKPLQEWSFKKEGKASETQPRVDWSSARLKMSFSSGDRSFLNASRMGGDKVFMTFDPVTLERSPEKCQVVVGLENSPVRFERDLGWYRINLDGVKPLGKGNDVIERIPLTLSNPTGEEQLARLMFEKSGEGLKKRLGSAITGITMMLCDENGEPTGIPVQLSKNWHREAAAGVYKGLWVHGVSQVRLPAGAEVKLQLVIANGHWGGVAAASHAQLSLIGWGSNQRWEQSALGCWGESICYEPAQGQAKCAITDVRPLMVTPMSGKGEWGWTNNVGGGDFFRLFDSEGKRQFHQAMKVRAFRQGPCLTDVEFSGKIGSEIKHSVKTSLARTDDLVRGTYRLRMDVSEPVNFTRLVIFQVGADTYNYTSEKRFVFGNEKGMQLERKTESGGDVYRTEPLMIEGKAPWVSLEEGGPSGAKEIEGAWANRGVIVREWKARLGGKAVEPHFAERGATRGRSEFSTIDLVPPAGVKRLESGDFVEAVIEYIVMPQKAEDYYGPNIALKKALKKNGGTWKMIHREVAENDRSVTLTKGKLVGLFPDVRVACEGDQASFELTGGIGYLPLTFTNLSNHDGYALKVNGERIDQSVHGKDFWQTDFDSASLTWSRTYNLPRDGKGKGKVKVEFGLAVDE